MNVAVLVILVLIAMPAIALDERTIVQGGVLVISLPEEQVGQVDQISALEKQWPCMQKASVNRCWIGVDLNTRPGHYKARWGKEEGQSLMFQVEQGDFRISKITVAKQMSSFDEKTLKRIRQDQQKLKASYLQGAALSPDLDQTIKPVEGVVSTPFGAQRYVNGEARSPHSGVDIAAPEGTPVKAPLSGKVVLVEDMYLNGNTVAVAHGSGLVSVFCHLQQANVKEGAVVGQGDVIGLVGQTGRSTGPHLHWGLRFHNARVNPYYLDGNG